MYNLYTEGPDYKLVYLHFHSLRKTRLKFYTLFLQHNSANFYGIHMEKNTSAYDSFAGNVSLFI